MALPDVQHIRDSYYLLCICLYAGDGQVSFIKRNGLRYRVDMRLIRTSIGYRAEKLKAILKQLEGWGYIYNVNMLNYNEARFTITIPKFLTMHPGEEYIHSNNWT